MRFLTKDTPPVEAHQVQTHRPAPVVSAKEKESYGELNAFLGKGCAYEGKLTFEGTVRIDGRFYGEIFSQDVLVIGQGAQVHAEIDVGVVVVSGEVTGNIRASDRIELRSPARLRGNISTPTLIVEEGVIFEGNCRMTGELDRQSAPPSRGSSAEAEHAKGE